VTKNEEEKTIQNGKNMVTKLRDKSVDFHYTLKIKRKLEKFKNKGRCGEEYFEYFCSISIRYSFVWGVLEIIM